MGLLMDGEPLLLPRQDMEAVVTAGLRVPEESQLALEQLRRELGQRISEEPLAVANFGLVVEHGRRATERQLKCALRLLADRNGEVEDLCARVGYLEGRIKQLERRNAGGCWWWPW